MSRIHSPISMRFCAVALMLSACSATQPPTPAPARPDAPVGAPGEAVPASVTDESARSESAAAPARTPVAAYRVVGTEPFWGIRVDGDTLHFTTLEDQAGKRLSGRPEIAADGIRYEGEHGGTAFALELERAACSDGMSETEYAYKAVFRYGEQTYSGCARPAE